MFLFIGHWALFTRPSLGYGLVEIALGLYILLAVVFYIWVVFNAKEEYDG